MRSIKTALYAILILLGAISKGYGYSPSTPSLTVDPRAYGSICGGFNTFIGDGSTTTFNYTIPFTGSSSTDNSSFFVFYEPTNGFGSSTILNSSQFSVTGVNTGVGGTITLNSPVPLNNTLLIAHDDAAGLASASTVAVAIGGSVVTPDNCTIYGSQTLGTQLTDGVQLKGQNSTPNYGFQGQVVKPYMRIIAPTGAPPAFGINISGKNQQSFTGFTVTSEVPGNAALGFLSVPVLIGANGASGAGGGQSPGIVLDNMTLNSGIVGFGAPQGGNSAYIFASVHRSNFTANTAGMYGPFSDLVLDGSDFAANGTFGSYGGAGGLIMGPTQGAVGAAGASRVENNRFEFNKEGVVIIAGGLINFVGNQYDGNAGCGMNLNTFWSNITSTGEWFRGNANGGGGFQGNTTAGQDAHICFNGTNAASGGFHAYNDVFLTNYSEGNVNPPGSNNATSPFYVLDFNGAAANNNDVEIQGGEAQTIAGNQGAAVTDFAIYRNGRPSNLKIDINGQTTQGKIANGSFPSQALGLPANSWTGLYVVGDAASLNDQYTPLNNGWGYITGRKIGLPPTYYAINNFGSFDCDVVNTEIVPNINPQSSGNPVVAWLPSPNDPTFGGGFYQAHLADTSICRLGGLTWAAIPQSLKVYAQTAAFATTGTWSNSSAYGGAYAITSNTNGSTAIGTFTGTGKAAYLWYELTGSDGGTFTWQLDSGPVSANVATQGNNAFTFPISSSSHTLGAIRIPVNSTGAHTITITVTSATGSSNNVNIVGIGTPSGTPRSGNSPTVFLGGQVYTSNAGGLAAANAAFNADEMQTANQLFADGFAVNFANVQQYFNLSTDILTGTSNFNSLGQAHIAKAFSDAIQGGWNAGNYVNPMDYGASCNTQYFSPTYFGSSNFPVIFSSGSPTVSVTNYHFQPGVATQNGGGDVGKVAVVNCFGEAATTSYIASVNAAANTATIGQNFTTNCAGGGFMLMGGYPSNPNNPATAHDDTAAIQTASVAAQAEGGKVFLPPNCMVHNLKLASGTELEGSAGGKNYGSLSYPYSVTPLYMGFTGYSDDVDAAGTPNNLGINTCCSHDVKLKDFMAICPGLPYYGNSADMGPTGFTSNSSAAIGTTTVTDLDPDHILLDHVSVFSCPVGFNMPVGYNKIVTFTGSISGNTMTVTAITSTNFAKYGTIDFLAVGRAVTGAGVTSGTVITTAPPNGLTGTYTLSKSSTVGSETLTSTPPTNYTSGTILSSQFAANAIGINGDLSDFGVIDTIFTANERFGWYLGPSGGSAASDSSRMIGGRFEENGSSVAGDAALLIDGSGRTQFTGVQWQFNLAPAIELINNWGGIQITGGWLDGNNSGKEQITLAGSGAGLDLSGVAANFPNFVGGGNSAYLIATAVGSTDDFISFEGGDMRLGYNTAFFNWTNHTPAHYKINVPGVAAFDNTISGIINSSAAQSTLNGTTAGTIVSSMPFQGTSYKQFIAHAAGYENNTAVNQTITFPAAFTNTPTVTTNDTSLTVSASTTTLTITAPNNTTTFTGNIVVQGE